MTGTLANLIPDDRDNKRTTFNMSWKKSNSTFFPDFHTHFTGWSGIVQFWMFLELTTTVGSGCYSDPSNFDQCVKHNHPTSATQCFTICGCRAAVMVKYAIDTTVDSFRCIGIVIGNGTLGNFCIRKCPILSCIWNQSEREYILAFVICVTNYVNCCNILTIKNVAITNS